MSRDERLRQLERANQAEPGNPQFEEALDRELARQGQRTRREDALARLHQALIALLEPHAWEDNAAGDRLEVIQRAAARDIADAIDKEVLKDMLALANEARHRTQRNLRPGQLWLPGRF